MSHKILLSTFFSCASVFCMHFDEEIQTKVKTIVKSSHQDTETFLGLDIEESELFDECAMKFANLLYEQLYEKFDGIEHIYSPKNDGWQKYRQTALLFTQRNLRFRGIKLEIPENMKFETTEEILKDLINANKTFNGLYYRNIIATLMVCVKSEHGQVQ